mgnify:CR=1|jgi:hypothetical protein
MTLKNHITTSIIISALIFAISKSWIIFTSSLISGVLIDCDHILDYLWSYRKRFRVKEFLNTCYCEKDYKCGVIFHSWELLLPLNLYAFLVSDNLWVMGITIGLTQHVVLDQIFNKSNWSAYFFFIRLKNGFDREKMFKID